jgi:hypothetical protein
LEIRNKALILGFIVGAFFAGRESVQVKTVTVTQEKIVYKESLVKNEKRNIHTIKKPDGTIETLDTTTLDSFLKLSSDRVLSKEEVKESASGVLVQGLLNNDLKYGIAVSKKFIGPIHLGAFGFQDLRFGVSVGVEL